MVPTMDDYFEYRDAVAHGLAAPPLGDDPADCADCADRERLGFGPCAHCLGDDPEADEGEPEPFLPHCRSCGLPCEPAEDADGDCASCADALQGAGSQSADSARAEARAAALDLARRAPCPPPDVQRDIDEIRWSGAEPWRPAARAVSEYETKEDAAGCGPRARALRLALADLHASLDAEPVTNECLAQRVLLRSAIGEALAGRSVRKLWSAVVTLRD